MAKAISFLGIEEEASHWKQRGAFLFGVDEAGRGCLAGPVCAAVNAWAPFSHFFEPPVDVRDSKKMTEAMRERAYEPIKKFSFCYGIGFASAEEIDRWNIFRATHLAVIRALENALQLLEQKGITLTDKQFTFLVDGNQPMVKLGMFFVIHPDFHGEFSRVRKFLKNFREITVVKGDSKIFSIASASVLAKVSRDHLMHELDAKYPSYEFAKHKGYSTALHVAKLKEFGACFEHRKTFSPVTEALALFP